MESYGKVPIGCCSVTLPGKLPCKYIIHTISPKYSKEEELKAQDLLSSCVINTLEMGKLLNVPSVSIPAISSGALGFPKDLCA